MGTYHEVNRYIDADELVQWFMSSLEDYWMENQEDVAPVIHAHWICGTDRYGNIDRCVCSNCKTDFCDTLEWVTDRELPNYCPNCGAVMDEQPNKT